MRWEQDSDYYLRKEFVEKNDGKIEVTSRINEGTNITFTMPLAKPLDKL